MDIHGFRKQYPQYNDLSDQQVAKKLYEKHYSDMPQEDFYSRFGVEEPPNQFMAGVRGFNTGVERLVQGAMQPILEGGYLGETLKNASKDVARQREEGYESARLAHPKTAAIGSVAGDLAATAPLFATGLGVSGRLAPHLTPILKTILGGALGGGAAGAARYTNEGESRAANALKEAAWGGAAGGVGHLAIDTIKKGIKLASNIAKANNPAKLAEKIAVTDKNAVSDAFSKRYKSLFDKASAEGVKDISAPKVDIERIIKHTTKDESHALSKFLKKPTLKRAHEADKDLGKAIRRLDKINKSAGLSTPKLKALNAAKKAQKDIQKSIKEGFEAKGKPELGKEYSDIKQAYKEEYLPYRTKAINEYLDKELTPKDFVKKLSKNEKFRAQMGEKYPELNIGGSLVDFLKSAVPAAAIGSTAYSKLAKITGLD